MMKIDRHYYYDMLEKNNDMLNNKEWLEKALRCTLEEHSGWQVSQYNLKYIINNNYTIEDYLDFISMKNKVIAEDLRKLENID